MHKDRIARYARQIALPQVNLRGQKRLAGSHVFIAGLGGLGSAAALYLANSGIGRLTINDFDRVDVTNLPRQILFDERDVDTLKTTATASRLRRHNPEVRIDELGRRLSAAELIAAVKDCDAVLDCTDNFTTRGTINRACHEAGRPLVTGAAIRFEGQLAVFRHDVPDGGACYNCLYTEHDENLENCAGQGILGSVVGTIGCMMATEAVKLLLGIESALGGKLWVYDGLAGTSKMIGIPRRDDCPVCGRAA